MRVLEIFIGNPSGANEGRRGQYNEEKEKAYAVSHFSLNDSPYKYRSWRYLKGVQDHPGDRESRR